MHTYYTPEALADVEDDIAVFARAEGLEAHARAALIRTGKWSAASQAAPLGAKQTRAITADAEEKP